jgi:SET domain-containing protein
LKIFIRNGKKRIGLKIKAIKAIKKGEELYLKYGTDYWSTYSGKKKYIVKIPTVKIPSN